MKARIVVLAVKAKIVVNNLWKTVAMVYAVRPMSVVVVIIVR